MTDPFLKNRCIVFILGSLELGGSERQALHLARYLKEQEQAIVHFLGFSGPEGKLAQMCAQYGIGHHVLPHPLVQNTRERFRRFYYFVRKLRELRPYILLPYTAYPNIACGLSWRWTGARLCVWNQRDRGIERLQSKWELGAARGTPLFISNSEHAGEFLQHTLGVPSDRMAVIRNGIELPSPIEARAEWRRKLGLSENVIIACMIGNLSHHKDHVTLLRAWQKAESLLKAKGVEAVLVLAGRFDPMHVTLVSLVSALGIQRSVRFLGQVDDVGGLLGAADLGVFSSCSEGSPNGLLECMAAALPVVATDIPGVREVVKNNMGVSLSPVGDDTHMSQKIIQYALDGSLRRISGEANREIIRQNFGLTRMCMDTINLISQKVRP